MNTGHFVRAIVTALFAFTSSFVFADQITPQPIRTDIGTSVQLDPTDGFNASGSDSLSVTWSWEARPATSVSDFSDANILRPIVTPDVAGTYLARADFNSVATGETLYSVIIEIGTDNVAPVAQINAVGAPQSATPLRLDGSQSFDIDGDNLTYVWSVVSQPAGATAIFSDETAPSTDVSVNVTGDYVVGLVVQDGVGRTSPQTLFELAYDDQSGIVQVAPVASTRFDHITADIGQAPIIEPYASTDINGDVLTYDMAIIYAPNGTLATLNVDDEGTYSFTADQAGDYLVSLNTADGQFVSSDQMLISVGEVNLRPVARIEQSNEVSVGVTATLDGTQSYDLDGDLLSYSWSVLSVPDGSAVAGFIGSDPQANITPDLAGTYVVQLVADDGQSASVPATTVLTTDLTTPIAVAGPDQVYVGAGDYLLDGGLSSVEPSDLSYNWSVIGGQGLERANLSGTLAEAIDTLTVTSQTSGEIDTAEFRDVLKTQNVYHDWDYNDQWINQTRPADGNLCRFGLWQRFDTSVEDVVVADGPLDQSQGDVPPNFNSEGYVTDDDGTRYVIWRVQQQRNAARNIRIELSDGSWSTEFVILPGTDAYIRAPYSNATAYLFVNGDQWRQSSPNLNPFQRTEPVCLNDGQEEPFSAVAQLIVGDAGGFSAPDTLFIGTGNLRPVVGAGAALEAVAGEAITLAATDYVFDANGDALSYDWSLINRPAGSAVELDEASSDTLDFTPDRSGVYLVQLIASDESMDSLPAVLVVSVENAAPEAAATITSPVFVGEVATLSGAGSFDPDGNALSYLWTITSHPDGSVAVIADPTAVTTSFVPDRRGTYEFALTVSDFELISEPATVQLIVPNQEPIAVTLEGPTQIELNEQAVFNASGSSDPDGDPITFTLEVITAPAGAEPVIVEISDGQFGLTVETAGDYVLELTVSDGITSSTSTLAVSATASNAAPVLGDIRDLYTVELGLEFALDLTGFDPDGDATTFYATPLPLADGITIDGTTGAIRFRPETGQTGTYSFTVGISDGTLTDETILVVEVVPGTADDTSVYGRVLDAADFAAGIETALAGMPVRLDGAALQTVTDVNGDFSFGSLTAGGDTMIIDPNADGGPGGYLATQRDVQITENQNRDLSPEFLLTPLNEGCAAVLAGQDTVLTGASTGVAITIAADTILNGDGSLFEGDVCLGALPEQSQQSGFPADTLACQIYGLSAPGASFSAGVSITAPNHDNLPEATRLVLWQNNESGQFRPSADAFVDPGAITVTSAGASVGSDGLFTFLPQAPSTVASADQPTGNRQLSVFNGDINEVYTLPGYFAFNQQQNVGLSYHSAAADPTVIVAGDVTINDDASLPVDLATRIEIGGLSLISDVTWTPREAADGTTPALIGEEVTLRQSMPVDASGLPSGRYSYDFYAKANYDCSTVSADHQAEVYVQNETDSPYGVGWSIDGLQKLTQSPDGKVAIIDDDGIATFDPKPTLTEFEDEPIVFPTIGTQGIRAADIDNDGDLDVVYGETGTGGIGVITNLGEGELSQEPVYVVADPTEVPETGLQTPNLLAIAVGQLDDNSSDDVAYAVQLQDGFGYIVNDGFGGFSDGYELLETDIKPADIAVIDLNTDTYEDIVYIASAGSGSNNQNQVWVSYGGETTREQVLISNRFGGSSSNPIQLEVGDIDGNGFEDIIYRNQYGIDFVFNEGSKNYTLSAQLIDEDSEFFLGEYFKLADFNSDGRLDVAYSTETKLEVYLNTTGREFADPIELARPPSATYSTNIQVADANGDGAIDIVSSVNGEVAVYINNGDGSFQPFESGFLDYGFGSVELADVNGDGSLDFVSTRRFFVTIHYSKPTASGEFNSGNGEFSTLTKLDDGTWERRYKDGMVVLFDQNGLQTAEVDPQGNRREYSYGDDGRLTTITDQVGGQTTFTYDALGRLASTTYPDGRTTSFEYDDEKGTLDEITEPEGSTVSFEYDDDGRLVSTTNQNGNSTGYNYDPTGNFKDGTLPDGSSIAASIAESLGLADGLGNSGTFFYVAPEDRVTTVTDRKGEITEVIVNEFGSPIQITDPLGRVTTITRDPGNLVTRIERPSDATPDGVRIDEIDYDNFGNVRSMTESVGTPEERTTQYEYEPEFNKVIAMTDAEGYVTRYEYDEFGENTKTINAEGGERSMTYSDEGKVTSRTDENGNTTTYLYDDDQNVTQITYADGSITTMVYDASGNRTAINEAVGTPIERQVQRTFDRLNRVLTVEVTGSDGAQIDGITSYTYEPAGNLATVTDETGLVTTMTYDELERLVTLDDPAEGLIQRTYNEAGEVTQHINGDGETHTYGYDDISRLTEVTDPKGYVKTFGYDSRNNVTSVTDGRSGVTTFGFDPLDRMITRTNPLSLTMTREYDTRDNLKTLTREDGLIETAFYDGLSRRTRVETPDNVLEYAYDPRSNLTEAADNDSRVTFTYDERNRLASTTTDGTVGPQPEVTISYTYDELDRRTSMSDSLGGTTTYVYDVEDRLTKLTAPWGTEYDFGYDGEGRRTSLTSTSGRNTSYSYTNGLLSALSHAQSGVALTDLSYTYDVDGQLSEIIDNLDPTKSRTINYDDLNRLIQVDEGIPASQGGVPIPIEDYAYDEEGNRLASHLSSLYDSNDHNQLEEDDSYTYNYDDRGNRVSRTSKLDSAVETYSYDSQNRLVGYASEVTTAAYAYDAMGRRIAKDVDGAVEAFVYDPWNQYRTTSNDVLLDFSDGSLAKRWLHGSRVDEPLAFEVYEGMTTGGAGALQEFYADRLGSITKVVDVVTGSVSADYTYNSFGQRTQTGTLNQRYGFTGREVDTETGLMYFRARHYDPLLGQFIQRDPIGFAAGDLNLYAYTWNDPYNWTDPSGLNSLAFTGVTGRQVATATAVATTVAGAVVCVIDEPCNNALATAPSRGGILGLAQAISFWLSNIFNNTGDGGETNQEGDGGNESTEEAEEEAPDYSGDFPDPAAVDKSRSGRRNDMGAESNDPDSQPSQEAVDSYFNDVGGPFDPVNDNKPGRQQGTTADGSRPRQDTSSPHSDGFGSNPSRR